MEDHSGACLCGFDRVLVGAGGIIAGCSCELSYAHCLADVARNRGSWVHGSAVLLVVFLQTGGAGVQDSHLCVRCVPYYIGISSISYH